MAGYVKLQRSIWHDIDFRRLDAASQRLYLLIISQPDMSQCGLLAVTPGRWAMLADDTDVATIRADLRSLADARFIVLDEATEELWVRSYMLYDGGYRTPNIQKSIVSALGSIMSDTIREQAVCAAETLGLTLTVTLAPRVTETLTETLTERVGETLSPRVTARVASSLQPAACSLQPTTSSLQPQPDPRGNPSRNGQAWCGTTEAAAAAVDIWIEHKCRQLDVRHPQRLRLHLRATVGNEYGTQLVQHDNEHPDATVEQILWDVFRLSKKEIAR